MDEWNWKQSLLCHIKSHPSATIQDLIKLLYQQEMGIGHMVPGEAEALQRVREERRFYEQNLKNTGNQGEEIPLYENIGNGWVRLNLQPLWIGDFSMKTLARMMVLSSKEARGNLQNLQQRMRDWMELKEEDPLHLNSEKRIQVARWLEADCPIPSHSKEYTETYSPHYRVVRAEYGYFFPLYHQIDFHLKRGKELTLAIDGPCGSGKSTLGYKLSQFYDGSLFHMDDYYLLLEQQTPERYLQPGENVDHQRFQQEVLEKILVREDVLVQRYDCGKGVLEEGKAVPYKPINIIEGSYSHHPNLVAYYHLKVFLSVDDKEQEKRLRLRNGEAGWRRFKTKWIPLENKYFDALKIREKADLVFVTDTDYNMSGKPEL